MQAYIADSSVEADGDLIQTATADESIDATVLAGSVAISGGFTGGLAAAGAGANAVNKIANGVRAFINDDGATGIIADSATLTAIDTSTIDAITGSASVAATVAPAGATAAIAVALADNKISNEVEASISNADHLLARVGDVVVTADETATVDALTAAAAAAITGAIGASFSGAGADATNTINNTVQAFIADSGHVAAEGGGDGIGREYGQGVG